MSSPKIELDSEDKHPVKGIHNPVLSEIPHFAHTVDKIRVIRSQIV